VNAGTTTTGAGGTGLGGVAAHGAKAIEPGAVPTATS
jgi:hypothetical protein